VAWRPDHGVSIGDVFPAVRPERAQDLIDAHDSGAVVVVAELYDEAVLARSRAADALR
jgi:hypothetical protein